MSEKKRQNSFDKMWQPRPRQPRPRPYQRGHCEWIGKYMQTNKPSDSFYRMLVFLPNGKICIELLPRIWEIIKGFMIDTRYLWAKKLHCQRTLTEHSDVIYTLAITSDNLIVTASDDHTARVWGAE